MNFNLYIFGNPGSQYNQYPQDYTKDFLSPLCDNLQGSRAIIFRHMDLMHYVYIENLGDNKYIGLCLIFNKIRTRNPKRLFVFLRDVIENQTLRSKRYIEYSPNGRINYIKSAFCEDVKSYEFLKTTINAALDNNDFDFEELHTNYNGVNKTDYCDWTDENQTIFELSKNCNTIIIEDSLGIKNNNTYQIISSLREEIEKKDVSIKKLNDTISSLEKQKKQYKKVILLFILVLCCCIGLFFLYDSLSKTENSLQNTRVELKKANDTIVSKQNEISNLQESISRLNASLENVTRLKNEAEAIVNKFKSASSLIITGGSYSFSENEYKCDYFTTESGTRSFKFKVIEEYTGDVYTTKEVSPYLDEGAGTFTVYFNRQMNSSHWYTFEIWQGNRLVGGSRH